MKYVKSITFKSIKLMEIFKVTILRAYNTLKK